MGQVSVRNARFAWAVLIFITFFSHNFARADHGVCDQVGSGPFTTPSPSPGFDPSKPDATACDDTCKSRAHQICCWVLHPKTAKSLGIPTSVDIEDGDKLQGFSQLKAQCTALEGGMTALVFDGILAGLDLAAGAACSGACICGIGQVTPGPWCSGFTHACNIIGALAMVGDVADTIAESCQHGNWSDFLTGNGGND